MASWSAKRRFTYGGGLILLLALILGGGFWKIIYKAPTCTDGFQNGEEKGVDCGGACKNICSSDTVSPIVLWSKIFNISGDVYSAVAYVENPNLTSKNSRATYKFGIYDSNNKLITTVEGETSIPKGKKFAVFETGIVLKNQKPKSADFQFLSYGPWEKDESRGIDVTLNYSTLLFASTTPRITGTIANNSTATIGEVELVVLVLDNNENVVAASRSFVDNLLKKSTQDFVFTWPKPFNLGVEACLNPVDVDLVLDKSGSMKSESSDPPEPFTTVLATARNFIKNLSTDDQIAITSFGTNSNQESLLSLNKESAIQTINSLFLSTTTLEQTNITGGLTNAMQELSSSRSRQFSKKVLILLTDGVPTEPQKIGESTYPATSALLKSDEIKSSGIILYTIGLGKNVNEDFLKNLSTDPTHYFFAPSKDNLSDIYSKIGSSICPKKPNVITVIYREI